MQIGYFGQSSKNATLFKYTQPNADDIAHWNLERPNPFTNSRGLEMEEKKSQEKVDNHQRHQDAN